MVSTKEERKAAEQAEKAISALEASPSNPKVEATINTLRVAINAATSAAASPTFSSETALNNARAEVGFAFPDLIKALENGTLAAEKIERAKRAVHNWKNKLAEP